MKQWCSAGTTRGSQVLARQLQVATSYHLSIPCTLLYPANSGPEETPHPTTHGNPSFGDNPFIVRDSVKRSNRGSHRDNKGSHEDTRVSHGDSKGSHGGHKGSPGDHKRSDGEHRRSQGEHKGPPGHCRGTQGGMCVPGGGSLSPSDTMLQCYACDVSTQTRAKKKSFCNIC